MTEQYAAQGYLAIAPALFERQEKGVELGYDATGFEKGIALMMKASPEGVLADVNAAIDSVAHAGRVGMVGYCWGGRVTYLAALQDEHRRRSRLLRRWHRAAARGHTALPDHVSLR